MVVKIGIIGGTGMKSLESFEANQTETPVTVFGEPESSLQYGKLMGVDCVLLSRHGHKHNAMPSNINYRANILALKDAGCTHIIATTACGSLKENIKPGEFVILDQFIDRTTKRLSTYYDGTQNGFKGVSHIPMRHPFSVPLREVLIKACKESKIVYHPHGTMITIEGPRFSTRAESKLFQSWGATVINMTTVPEVVLANELGMLYGSLAMVTDYDCWRDDNDHVSVESVLETMKENGDKALKVIAKAVELISRMSWDEHLQEAANIASNSVMLF